MTKSPKLKILIEENRETLTTMLSGASTTKRLNNLFWLRNALCTQESKTLFHMSAREQAPWLDYSSMKNIGDAYDYIIENPNAPIDTAAICRLHNILCMHTNIAGSTFRTTQKILEIMVNGMHYHAPDARKIPSELNRIVYELNDTSKSTLVRAYNVHYDLIMLQPFDDFNKRTARMVMNWVLIQGDYRPIVFNHPTDKIKYKEAIAARANGDTRAYATYMSTCMLRTQREILQVLTKSRVM